jgi:hypothetical protein
VLITSLGGKDEPEVRFRRSRATSADGDSFLLCSDGLWAYFDDAEMGRIVAENSARRASQILIDAARAARRRWGRQPVAGDHQAERGETCRGAADQRPEALSLVACPMDRGTR